MEVGICEGSKWVNVLPPVLHLDDDGYYWFLYPYFAASS